MKKLILLAAAVAINCLAWAGHMSMRIPEAEMPSRIVAADSATADTLVFLPGLSNCYRVAAYDQLGMYYMMLTFLNSADNVVPQLQVHMLVNDTMCISGDDNRLLELIYYENQTTGYKAVDADVELNFVQYDTTNNVVRSKYDIVATVLFANHQPIISKYRGYVSFYNYATRDPYVPSGEKKDTGINNLHSQTSGGTRKLIRNGRVLIERHTAEGIQYFDLLGNPIED